MENDPQKTAPKEMLGGLYAAWELANLLDIGMAMLAQWRSRGEGPAFIRIGSKPYYRLKDVREWIESLPTRTPAKLGHQKLKQ